MPLALAKIDNKSRSHPSGPGDARRSGEPGSVPSQSGPGTRFGADIKAYRQERNISLGQAAQETRISLRHLQNLEEGNYPDLPGGMYNRAFLRNYCVYLGLEPQPYIDRYERESAQPGEKVSRPRPALSGIPSEGWRIPPLLVWSVMFLLSVAGLYFSRGWISAVFSPYFAQHPEEPLPIPEPPPPAQPPAATPIQMQAADSTTATDTAAPLPDAPPAADPTTTPAIEPAAGTQIPGTIRIQFEVVQACWTSVSGDGRHIMSRILQPGETPSFTANESFELILGNAGGVRLRINGEPAKALGAPGTVARVLINPATIPDLLARQRP